MQLALSAPGADPDVTSEGRALHDRMQPRLRNPQQVRENRHEQTIVLKLAIVLLKWRPVTVTGPSVKIANCRIRSRLLHFTSQSSFHV
jgi:hypothetical protein